MPKKTDRPHAAKDTRANAYGVYVLNDDQIWHLEKVVGTKVAATIAAHAAEKWGNRATVAGPWTGFPEWLES